MAAQEVRVRTALDERCVPRAGLPDVHRASAQRDARGNRKGTGCGKRMAPTSAGRFSASGAPSPGRLRRRPAVLHAIAFASDGHDVGFARH